MQNSVGQQNTILPQQCQCQQQIQQTSVPAQQYQTQPTQGQNVQVPNYSGVNIQIFNPSVATPGSNAPVYNVNAPNYNSNTKGCYPSDYYTQNYGNNDQNGQSAQNNSTTTTTTNNSENKTTDKKTEKREIVQLTDDYIKNLENYLNSQDKEIRLMGAKEVVARLEEDHSRKDDKALNALVNKMLQDPYSGVKLLALSALDSRIATGDNFTVGLLQNMQNSKSGYGQDALQASNILLKMSGQTVEKEFEVKNNKSETKTQSKK